MFKRYSVLTSVVLEFVDVWYVHPNKWTLAMESARKFELHSVAERILNGDPLELAHQLVFSPFES